MDAFLVAVDLELLPRGFRRRARSQEWTKLESNDTAYVHLNFGKVVVNPSVGVLYRDLASSLPPRFGSFGASAMLTSLVPTQPYYDRDMNASVIARDLVAYGLPMIAQLADREFVVRRLKSEVPQDWPTHGYAARIRLLPLLLRSLGRAEEAQALLSRFERESAGLDQLVPVYRDFAVAVREAGTA